MAEIRPTPHAFRAVRDDADRPYVVQRYYRGPDGWRMRVSVRLPPKQDHDEDGPPAGNHVHPEPIDERGQSSRLAPLFAACRRFRQARCPGPEDGQRDR